MADIFRGPLFVGRRELLHPLFRLSVFVAAPLLTLAPSGPLPVGAQSLEPAPHRQRVLVDTCQSSRVILPAAVAPPFVPVDFPVPSHYRWINRDTSQGWPKVLYGDSVAPFANPQFPVPDAVRPVTDTSRSAYGTTFPVVITILPTGQSTYCPPQLYGWNVVDTSHQTPIVLDFVPPPTPPSTAGGGGGAQGGGKRQVNKLVDDLPLFQKLKKKKKAQSIEDVLRELDEPVIVATTPAKVAVRAEAVIEPTVPKADYDKVLGAVESLQKRIEAIEESLKEPELPNTEEDDAEVLAIVAALL